jgi:hypothetical protein
MNLREFEFLRGGLFTTSSTWKLKPIEGFRFLWKGLLQASPFQTIPASPHKTEDLYAHRSTL